jgi:hypothetical protein
MLAALAAICFLLALLNVAIGDVDLMLLGLFVLALHFAITDLAPRVGPWVSHR